MFKFNRKGVASLATFSFIVMLLILIFILAYSYYDNSKDEISTSIARAEMMNSLHSFRSALLNNIVYEDSNLSYVEKYAPLGLGVNLENKTISGEVTHAGVFIEENISSLGVSFCSNYTVYPVMESKFHFNGSCVSVTS